MLNSRKIDVKTIVILLVSFCLISVIVLVYNFFKNEYYDQVINLERIERIKLEGDIATIRDFQPEGMKVEWKHHDLDWKGNPLPFYETLLIEHESTCSKASIELYRSREEAAKDFSITKNSVFNRPQTEKKINSNDTYYISKVARLRDSDFGGFFKTNQYHSEVIFLKNNLVVSIYSYNYNDNTGSSKQIMIDTVSDYLEKLAAKEKTL